MNPAIALRHPESPGHVRAAQRAHLAAPPEQRSVTLQFDDNGLLPLLYGEHDRHLARIEQRLGIRLGSRGNRITIAGAAGR